MTEWVNVGWVNVGWVNDRVGKCPGIHLTPGPVPLPPPHNLSSTPGATHLPAPSSPPPVDHTLPRISVAEVEQLLREVEVEVRGSATTTSGKRIGGGLRGTNSLPPTLSTKQPFSLHQKFNSPRRLNHPLLCCSSLSPILQHPHQGCGPAGYHSTESAGGEK